MYIPSMFYLIATYPIMLKQIKIRIGMSGEPAPRFIIASKTRIKSSGKVSKCASVVYSITTPTASKCNG